eukprot:GHUV01013874.1.p1 GENE.GHUV01013874.1~~GHUV01013874.1.p1  ORF type:complete len:1255 (+),score=498.10 GHUV01013874.1:389-4153(+)
MATCSRRDHPPTTNCRGDRGGGTGSARRRPVRSAVCFAARGDIELDSARQLLEHLSTQLENQQPHFGSRLAGQLLHQLESAVQQAGSAVQQQLPIAIQQVPNIQMPDVQLPEVHFPATSHLPAVPQLPSLQLPDLSNVQLLQLQLPELPAPAVQLPTVQLPTSLLDGQALLQSFTSAAGTAADEIAQLPINVQQQLDLLQQQLLQLAATADSSGLEPHFGTRALTAWLQDALQTLSFLVHMPVLQMPAAGTLASHLLFGGGGDTGLASLAGESAATVESIRASLQVLSAAAYNSLPSDVSSMLTQTLTSMQGQSASAITGLQQLQISLLQLQQTIEQLPQRGIGGYDLATICLVAAGAVAATAASVPPTEAVAGGDDDIRDVLTHEYDAAAVAAYFRRRPVLVAQRSLQLAGEMANFGVALLGDYWTNRLQANEHIRAEQLRGAIERLGPAYVKVAQALSTRVDLLSPEYFKQVQLLQDRVPPFPCEQAREVMSKAFGRPVDDVFTSLSSKPVAAASLGQVYKGRLRPEYGGIQVAVKVQRPDVLEQVCLDLYLMRQAAEAISARPEVKTDWALLIDNWAVRFLHEMDYTREAANGKLFREQMAAAGVTGVVTADVIDQLSDDVVLTTAWVDGEKLSESRAADVRELCNTLLSAYLIQLLDTGLLHADPHPGNLIRTTDGKICVLDFGLMTEVTPEQRIALVEYISHLTTQDWENVARDLQTLGFIPADAGDPVAMGMAEPLGKILIQLSGGGGATKLNIDAVMSELEDLGSTYPFRIPAFFALILRAFSVIEGIALAVDPDYAIVQECFPYMSRRLLSDDDPRVRKALKDVLYGGRSRLDIDRLIRLSEAFSAYTTDGLSDQDQPVQLQRSQLPAAASSGTSETLSPAAKDALLVVFSKKGSYVQELLVEELVAAADALSREALSDTLRRVLGSAPAVVAMSSLEALGPLRPLLVPFVTPLELLSRLAPAVALTAEDEEALGVVRGIFQLVQRAQVTNSSTAWGADSSSSSYYSPAGVYGPASTAASGMVFSSTSEGRAAAMRAAGFRGPMDPHQTAAAAVEALSDAAGIASELQPLLPELLPGIAHTGRLFVRAFLTRVATRLSEGLAMSDVSSTAEIEAERELAMAALGFVSGQGIGRGGAAGSSKVPNAPLTYSSSANQFGYRAFNQQQRGAVTGFQYMSRDSSRSVGFTEGAGVAADAAVGFVQRGLGLKGPIGPGQVVTGLLAAPLLMVVTPLSIMNEMQRKQQEQQE